MSEPSPRPWCIDYTPDDCVNIRNADGDIVARVDSDANAALIVDAVNLHDVTRDDRHKLQEANEELFVLRAERDRIRDELADRTRNYEDVIACHQRTEESLRDIVRRLTEYADAVAGYRHCTIEVLSSEHPAWTFDGEALLREARAAIGEGQP